MACKPSITRPEVAKHSTGLAGLTWTGVPARLSCVWEWCARRDSNPHDVTHCHLKAARLPIPPRALKRGGTGFAPDHRIGADVTKRRWGDKTRWRRDLRRECGPGSAATYRFGQH